jgi:hypothetical protein
MNAYKKIINNLLPADDLHWCKEEQKYVSLSEEETNEIIVRCMEQGMNSLEDVYKFVSWCGSMRVGELLWKNYLSGHLEVVGFDENNEPLFSVAGNKP